MVSCQRETLGPLRQSLVECREPGGTRTARQMQCGGEIDTLVEVIDRRQHSVAIFERDVLDARQRAQDA